jgi:phospholipid/cholesterol/gamma-HCH transport system substrate-binding protein
MAKQNVEFRVGVIILMGIAIIAISLYWLQGYKLKMNSRLVQVVFDDVGTLAIGDKVTVSGVSKGKVDDLLLTASGVRVELQLNRDVNLRRDATIVIKNMGLMGERFVAINPGRDTLAFDYTEVVAGLYDTGLPEVMGLMGEMIQELHNLVVSFKQTVGSDSSLASFNRTFDNLESVSASLVGYMDRNEKRLDKTAENLVEASQRLNRVLADNADRVDSTLTRFDRSSARVEKIVGVLDTLALSAREFADHLGNPEGSLQLLLTDRRLYDDLRRTADNIDDLITDIQENPRKYINLKVELF